MFVLKRSVLGAGPIPGRWALLLTLAVVISTAVSGCGGDTESIPPAPTPTPTPITARQLVEPGALVGPGPSSFAWSPTGARLAYVAPIADGSADVLWLYEAATGTKRVLLDPSGQSDSIDVTSAQWSVQGETILLSGANALWLLDVATGTLSPLAEGGATDAQAFLPSGTAVSFVRGNDLYTARISDGHIARFTLDGSDTIYNGTLDWVYNEEIATRTAQPAYSWSPDGQWLLLMRTDDGPVATYPITSFVTDPPTTLFTRYPTAGSPNPAVSLHLIVVRDGEPDQTIELPENAEYILPFFTWAPDSSEAFYITLNRAHTVLKLKAWNPTSGTGRSVIQETDPHWINEFLYSAPVFLGDGERFLWASERSGFMHLYLYSRAGQMLRQLTQGDWLVDTTPWDVLRPDRPVQENRPGALRAGGRWEGAPRPGPPVHIDPTGNWVYFSTTQSGPRDRQLTRLNIASGALTRLSLEPGFHFGILSGDGQYLLEQFSNVDTPPVIRILKPDGTPVEILGRYEGPSLSLPKLTREFLTIKAHDGVDLYAQIVRPEGFDPGRRYGVVIHWYGGPTLQLVSNRYGTTNIFNHIERDVLYTQAGFIVWRLDNRGSLGRGHAFETPIAGEFGPAALDDQLAGVEYLKTLPYVDSKRIGTDGKSFGGFLTLYALIHSPEVFPCGVAGSGPTDWRDYDSIYTERYMGTPEENPDGYAAANLVTRAAQIEVRPLLIHGLVDTNVHLQNTLNLIDAMMALDKPFDFLPLPNSDHHYGGDDLVSVLSESTNYFEQCLGSR
ncbi:MAG: DPP IV N-terminal domain-containing protein [Candidatus Binatia bacterium]